jgi:hypothetical protein
MSNVDGYRYEGVTALNEAIATLEAQTREDIHHVELKIVEKE